MSDPANDDLPLEATREILAKMTPAEQAVARAEASAKGVSVDLVIWQAVQELIEIADREEEEFLQRGNRPSE